MSKSETTVRDEIQDLYFWLGEEAERIGFTPWQTAWVTQPATMLGASDGKPYVLNGSGLWERTDVE